MWRVPYIWGYVHSKILEISSISTVDWINLSAHYSALLLGVNDEEAALRDRGFTEEQIRSALKNKKTPSFEINGLRFTAPITRFKDESLGYLLLLLEQFELGNLPYAGPVTEQPAQIMEVFELLKRTKSEILNREQKRQNGRLDKNHNRPSGRSSKRGT